jgi:hypothetical protein
MARGETLARFVDFDHTGIREAGTSSKRKGRRNVATSPGQLP